MTAIERVKGLYGGYLDKALQLEKDRKIGEGLLGIGKKPADDPCHEKFADDMAAALKEIAEGKPDSAAASEILHYIYSIPAEHEEPKSVYWMLIAVHGCTKELIPLLSPSDAEALRKEYGKMFRRWQRLPVQQEIFKALGNAAKR